MQQILVDLLYSLNVFKGPEIFFMNTMLNKLTVVSRITPRKFDTVQASKGHKSGIITSDVEDLTLNKRGIRTSFTFRKVRQTPCNCSKYIICFYCKWNKSSLKIFLSLIVLLSAIVFP